MPCTRGCSTPTGRAGSTSETRRSCSPRARSLGLEEDEIRAALASPAFAQRIALATEAVTEIGAGGVPAFVIDRRLLVPGAQPHEVFERILERLGHAPVD